MGRSPGLNWVDASATPAQTLANRLALHRADAIVRERRCSREAPGVDRAASPHRLRQLGLMAGLGPGSEKLHHADGPTGPGLRLGITNEFEHDGTRARCSAG